MWNETLLERIDTDGPAPETEPDRQYFFMKKCRELVSEMAKTAGRPLTYLTETLGCQMNAKDSEKMTAILEFIGYVPGGLHEKKDGKAIDADFVLYNTCTVRENANQKIYGHLGFLKNQKERHPEMKIALCGCMMQEPDEVERVWKSYPFVDIVFGTHNIYKLAEILYKQIASGSRVVEVWDEPGDIVEDLPGKRKYPFKTGVNIMYGCNNFCTYCIVPYVRGRERSREADEIIGEIRGLVEDGVTEVMLLGQNVNSYGHVSIENNLSARAVGVGSFIAHEEKASRVALQESTPAASAGSVAQGAAISFADLLRRVNEIEGLRRIRFMTSHPKDLSDDLIDAMAECEKVCDHLHLPLQSGSSEILRKMNRHYDKESYLSLVDRLRVKNPDIALTTDIIVGFPGETESDFDDTLDVIRRVGFDGAYTFIYSKRTGTPAARMEGTVPDDVVKDRFDRLLAEIHEISEKIYEKRVGGVYEALIEEVNEKEGNRVSGRLSNNVIVHVSGDSSLIGKYVSVRLEESKGFYYLGKIVEK